MLHCNTSDLQPTWEISQLKSVSSFSLYECKAHVLSHPELGFVLSKGSNGIKKDMKEAAKWYRMAVSRLELRL